MSFVISLNQLSQILNCSPENSSNLNPKNLITGIATDTRNLAAGEAFVALQGVNFDGHNFVELAIEKRC